MRRSSKHEEIGVLVQNYSATRIDLESPIVKATDRTSGPVVVQHGGTRKAPLVGVNEIF